MLGIVTIVYANKNEGMDIISYRYRHDLDIGDN